MIYAFAGLNHSARAQIGTADARDQEHVRVGADLFRRLLDACEFFLVVGLGKVHPAQEIVAGAAVIVELTVGQLYLRIDCVVFFRTDKFCQMFAIKFDTHCTILLYLL